MQQPAARSTSSRQRPLAVTIVAIVAAIGGIAGVLGVLAGAVIHGVRSLDAVEVLIVLTAVAMAALYLAVAYGAWTLKPWAWTLGLFAGAGTIVYMAALLIRGWSNLIVDAPPLAVVAVLVAVLAAVGLFFWFRRDVKAAFGRA